MTARLANEVFIPCARYPHVDGVTMANGVIPPQERKKRTGLFVRECPTVNTDVLQMPQGEQTVPYEIL